MAYNFLNNSGIVVADTDSIYQEVEQEYKKAFGSDLVTTADSPAGVLITAETIARTNTAQSMAEVANQINPDIASGVFLDAILALTGGARTKATSTSVTATLTGVAGAVIPAGSQAKTNDENIFSLVSDTLIPASGSTTATFLSVEKGAIPCTAGALNTIVSQVLGWETINNTDAGTLGLETQSDIEAREKRKLELAIIGRSTVEAICSALYSLTDVKSLSFRENTANTTQTIDGIQMIAHSIYVCVDGGTDEEIAKALLDNKTLGAGYNGSQEVSIIETISGQKYTVKFDRPTLVQIQIKISVKVISYTGSPQDFVKNAILAYANNPIKTEGFTVGNDVSPVEIASSVAVNTGFFVSDIQIKKQSDSDYVRTTIPIALNERANTTANLIEVEIL
ncbi:Uncharacterized homolog of phage Mu protein gp47 [Campylobacter hyointestinalis subsp. hyointestinalis]|uniref:Uncharacterized homolog of phage Mu protein gp47 n=1 Tax=Campylobacter hyointestinalis subsp. hyointestinalis TaxID=91352 RepID=A0A9W5AI01_CAMHY|nr:baseplate J/gp47 family protein [Campylobacter hyointestinalis]CUU68176.1 Uncharacterized homolog of phage Mu protein gp47 [Campylobacter hyointestinalis subsp. hyointestinalis]